MAAVVLPSPPSLPFVGNLFELDGNALIQSLTKFSRELGPIYRLDVLGGSTIVLGGQQIVNEVCDEKRFGKLVHSALLSLRPAIGDALFTAHDGEPNWGLAHRILMPAFGPLGVRGMFGKMVDIARQMFDRWERFGPDEDIDVSDTMTRLTLDTLALCAFDMRFNSFYREDMHPFVDAMVGALVEASARDRRPGFVNRALLGHRQRFDRNVASMHVLADRLVSERRRDQRIGERGDLLDLMLAGRDPDSDAALSDENIRFQLVTFLIAGHETTSGLLSFAVHLLLENPEVLVRVRQEVDDQLGDREPALEDLTRLPLVEQLLMETLRLWPTAPAFAVTPHGPDVLANGLPVQPGDELLVLLPALHRDPKVWGDDADDFRPERFTGGAARQLPPNAWKPFGNGQRACIGRGFAMQEAQLVMAMLLHRFDFVRADPEYRLRIAETLTIKPEGLRIRARRRSPVPTTQSTMVPSVEMGLAPRQSPPNQATKVAQVLVLHGGNAGSSATFARRVAAEIGQRGRNVRISTMDQAVDRIGDADTVIIVTASYEGQPADNAKLFVAWLENLSSRALEGRQFGVLGCGNRQWARTYQAVPKRVDQALEAAGASRLIARGEADAGGDFVEAAEAWIADVAAALAPDHVTSTSAGIEASVTATILPRPQRDGEDQVGLGRCHRNVALSDTTIPDASVKRHIEVCLPAGTTYDLGDYLAVWASNPPTIVARALRRLELDPNARVLLTASSPAGLALPLNEPLPAKVLCADYVEWQRPVTNEQLRLFSAHLGCPPDRARIEALISQDANNRTIGTLALMESLPSLAVPLGALLASLPPMEPRRYSIASSPRLDDALCALTISVLDAPSTADRTDRHLGVASNYLSCLAEGAPMRVSVRPGAPGFCLPLDPAIPLVMIAAGSGIAPFRAFLQDRACQADAGVTFAPARLYFGCRAPLVDWLYRGELEQWVDRGLLDLRMSFSRQPVEGCRYVQDLIRRDDKEIAELVLSGAHLYVCGDAFQLVPAAEAALLDVGARSFGRSPAVAARWARRHLVSRGRYAVDAFT